MDSYFYSIAFYFLKRTKRGVFLNSIEINLIREWQKADIPLDIVIRGLKEGFKKPGKKRSLNYFKKFVEKEFKAYKKLKIGKTKDFSAIKHHYKDKIESIKHEIIKKLIYEFLNKKINISTISELDEKINKIILTDFWESEKEQLYNEWKDIIESSNIPEDSIEEMLKKSLIYKKRDELLIPDVYTLFGEE